MAKQNMVDELFDQGIAAVRAGDLETVCKLFSAVVKGNPESEKGWFATKVPGNCTLKLWEGLSHELHNEPEKEQAFEYLIHWLTMILEGAFIFCS